MSRERAGILFDLGGTLVDYDGPGGGMDALNSAYRAVYDVAVHHGYSGDLVNFQGQFQRLEDLLWEEAKAGRRALTLDGELVLLFRQIELRADPGLVAAAVEAYCRSWQSRCAVYPDSHSALRKLKADGLKIGLVSNTALPGTAHTADLDRFGLLPCFDDLVFSSEVGLWKPQPEVYNLALSRLGLSADVAVFVGDRLVDDVVGAQRAGLRGILIVRDDAEPVGDQGGSAMGSPERAGGDVPDARIRSLAELPEVLHRLDGGSA